MIHWRTIVAMLAIGLGMALTPLRAQPAPDVAAAGQTNAPSLVLQIVKLLRAHTDPQVIQAFITGWTTPYLTSADDLVQLRAAGSNQAVLNAYARRGAELRLSYSMAHPENRQTVLFYPEQSVGSGVDSPMLEYPAYPFSDALWWWANRYPMRYPGPVYGFGYWGSPRRWRP